MRLLQGKDIDEASWDALAQSPDVVGASVYQTRTFYHFLCQQYGMSAFAYALEDNGELLALMVGSIYYEGGGLRRVMSRRAIVHGGPIVRLSMRNKQAWLAEYLKTIAMNLKNDAIYLEIRNYHDYSAFAKAFDLAGFQYNPHLNVVVNTEGQIYRQMSENRRREVRQAQQNGAEIIEQPTIQQVKEWYRILSGLYRSKVKTPLLPWSFFHNIMEQPWSEYLLVRYRGKIIGGILAVYQEGKGFYEWYVCGQDHQYPLQHPSTMATYAAIEKAKAKGCYFDFMGAGKPNQPYGVRNYKTRFGGEQVEYGRYLLVEHNVLYQIGCMGVRWLKIRSK